MTLGVCIQTSYASNAGLVTDRQIGYQCGPKSLHTVYWPILADLLKPVTDIMSVTLLLRVVTGFLSTVTASDVGTTFCRIAVGGLPIKGVRKKK